MLKKHGRLMVPAAAISVGVSVFLAADLAFAQCDGKSGFALKACEVETGKIGANQSTADRLKGTALSTTFADTVHLDVLPPSVDPKAFRSLKSLNRSDDGSFILKVGIYEASLQSFPLNPGPSGSLIGGLYPAPIKGTRGKVVADALKQAELHPELGQGDIQQLLSAIVSGVDLEKMQPQVQQTAAALLSPEAMSTIKGSAVAKTVETQIFRWLKGRSGDATEIGRDTTKARAEINTTDQKYDVSKTLDDLQPLQSSDDGPVLRGTWAKMPGGFYVRYLPDSLVKTRFQVIVPEDAGSEDNLKTPLLFDPTRWLAVFAVAPNVRLGITMRAAK